MMGFSSIRRWCGYVRTIGERILYGLFLLPGAAILAVLFLVPLVFVVLFSFGTTDIVGRPQLGTTFYNFQRALEAAYVPVLLRTIAFASAATLIALVLAYPIAYFASRFAGRFGPIMVGAILLSWLVDYLVRIYAWTALLAPEGIINSFLGYFDIGPLKLLGTNVAVVLGLVYTYGPLAILTIYASLGQLKPGLIDAGKDLFGTPFQTFRHVTLPATMSGVVGGMALVFLPSMGDFACVQFLGGVNSTMLGNLISLSFLKTQAASFGSALTVQLLVVMAIGLIVVSVLRHLPRRGSGKTA
jgi:spermidine/putrescine transport system permease protein